VDGKVGKVDTYITAVSADDMKPKSLTQIRSMEFVNITHNK